MKNPKLKKLCAVLMAATISTSLFVGCGSNDTSNETITFDNALITERTYSYDVNGMLSSITDNIFGSHTYLYNHLGYLTFERTIDNDGNMISDTTYSYDLNVNILTNGNNQYA